MPNGGSAVRRFDATAVWGANTLSRCSGRGRHSGTSPVGPSVARGARRRRRSVRVQRRARPAGRPNGELHFPDRRCLICTRTLHSSCGRYRSPSALDWKARARYPGCPIRRARCCAARQRFRDRAGAGPADGVSGGQQRPGAADPYLHHGIPVVEGTVVERRLHSFGETAGEVARGVGAVGRASGSRERRKIRRGLGAVPGERRAAEVHAGHEHQQDRERGERGEDGGGAPVVVGQVVGVQVVGVLGVGVPGVGDLTTGDPAVVTDHGAPPGRRVRVLARRAREPRRPCCRPGTAGDRPAPR
ncbi:MAG: hypothetical protein V7633_5578 [Pseudonocardia sp.]